MEEKFASEQIEKARECKTVEELIALAKENCIDLTEAERTPLFGFTSI